MTESTATYGDHYLVDLYGCDESLIADVKPTEKALLEAAEKCGSTIIEYIHE